jgi:hypothetical protein
MHYETLPFSDFRSSFFPGMGAAPFFFVLTKSDVFNDYRTGNIPQPSAQRWDIEYIGIECLNRVFIPWKLLEG